MIAWVGVIVSAALAILKGLFGIDHPVETEVKNEKPEMPVDGGLSDADRRKQLGL
jgi:hypothetical protein